ncbi:MAG: (Fe-S)-binding protein [Proteobacteria bacterium]|nr:(Fe-S)-binding protein [Pseudomonadota bacterium]MBU1386523.1 (Fe-S)-binding protein [Pseudomonadota bacterium]MBU1544634.1 (Fe-S)-binding protein [Pseudomonadota bacterium]MBU2429225.1 (Fe-S)-binding protein [Pseudomonadota bacterium]MBU2481387.1 (Fe-S)-binding protein [Pseudomonadota bacterium]
MQDVKTNKKVIDEGVEAGLAKLTPEKIASVINQVLEKETGARFKAYVQTCMRCGLCSDACSVFLSNDRAPQYSPAAKVKQTILEMINKKGRVSREFLSDAVRIAHTECNVCKRCSMYCPFGIDIAYMMLTVRRIIHKLEITPLYIQDTVNSHAATGNQMWVKQDEWIDTLQWQEEDAREEFEDLRIPLDKDGSDIMYSVIAPEPKFQAGLIYQMATIMHAANVNWTMPSTPGWDNSNMAMYTGDFETSGRIARIHYEAAANLHVKKIVMGECGHAFRSVYDVGNRWVGWTAPPIELIHAIDFYHFLLTTGRIKVKEKYKKSVTLHDPCNISRGRGLHHKAREIVNILCENFIEMTPNKEHNYCCGAGGGVINCGPPWKGTRMVNNKEKSRQLKRTGAQVLIAPCHNCHSGLEDIVEHYELGMEIKFFGDIIFEVMEKTIFEEGN